MKRLATGPLVSLLALLFEAKENLQGTRIERNGSVLAKISGPANCYESY